MKEFIFPYKSEFTDFAKQDVSESSVKSYYSYLNSLDEHLFKAYGNLPHPFFICNAENLAKNADEVRNILSEWQDIIDGEIDEPDILAHWTEKTIRNWRSAFNKYVEFIEERLLGQKEIQKSKEVYVPSPKPIKNKKPRAKKVIIRKTLEEKIARCLRGQDRLSAGRDTNLPINYISQILTQMPGYKRGGGFLNNWVRRNMKKVVAKVRFENGEEDSIKASEIVSLRIYGQTKPVEVIYGKEKKKATMLTRTAADGENFEEMYLDNNRQLHIDHEPSVDTILRKWGDCDNSLLKELEDCTETLFPNLKHVSKIIQDIARKHGLNEKDPHDPALAEAIKNDAQARTEIVPSLPGIEKELELFDTKITRLEFMLGSENTSKGTGQR